MKVGFIIESVVVFAVLVIVFLPCTKVDGQLVLKCMSCRKAVHFTHCEEMVTCKPETQLCYVEEEIDAGGEVVVNAGCRDKEQCNAIGCFGDSNKRRKRTVDSRMYEGTKNNMGDLDRDVICHHCCDGDFCNMYGCPDSFDVSHLPGSRCFVCDHVLEPEHCNVVKNCEAGYSCGQELFAVGDGERFHLKCIRTRMCELLKLAHNSLRRKRNGVQLWSDCCDSHLCNGYKPMRKEAPSMHSATYQCPARISGRPASTSVAGTNPPMSTHYANTTTISTGPYPHEQATTTTLSTTSTTSMTTTTTATTTPTTTSEMPCEDVDLDCDIYGVEYICHGTYEIWARQHCRKYCGFCGTKWMALSDNLTNTGTSYVCLSQYFPSLVLIFVSLSFY